MNTKQRATLYHELAKLLGAGLHLDRGLELLLDQSPSAPVRAYLLSIQKGLSAGRSFAESAASHPEVTRLEASLLTAGERGGRLEHACEHLARYFDLQKKSSDKATGAMVYPLILLHLGLILPDLPALVTGGNLFDVGLGIAIRLVFLWGVLGLLLMGWKTLSVIAQGTAAVDALLNKVPLVGAIRRHWALARFSQVFQTGLLASLKVTESLHLAGEASQSAVLHDGADRAARLIEQKGNLAGSLRASGAFPKVFLNAVETAEQTGTLDKEMQRWAEAESALAALAQDRAAEWLPRIFYVIVVLYIASRIIGMFGGTMNEYQKLLDGI